MFGEGVPEGEEKTVDKNLEKKLVEMDERGEIELNRVEEEPEKVAPTEPEENASEPEPEVKKLKVGDKEYTEDELLEKLNRPEPSKEPEKPIEPNALKEKLAQLRESAVGDDALLGVLDMLEPMADKLGSVSKLEEELKVKNQLENDKIVISKLKEEAEKKYGHAMPDFNDPDFKTFIQYQTTASPYDLYEMYKGKREAPIAPRKPLKGGSGEDDDSPTNQLKAQRLAVAKKMGLKGRFIK